MLRIRSIFVLLFSLNSFFNFQFAVGPVSTIKQTYRALVIEDQDLMRVSLIRELKAVLSECVVLGAASFEQALTLLHGGEFDLVVIDPGMPGYNPTLSETELPSLNGSWNSVRRRSMSS